MPVPISWRSVRPCGAKMTLRLPCSRSMACSAAHLPDHRFHGPRVFDGVAVDVVVEIAPHAAVLAQLLEAPVRPLEQSLIRVAAVVFSRCAVKAYIGRLAAGPARRLQAFEVMRDETNAVAIEGHQHVLVVPALVTELDDMLEVAGQ